MEPAKVVTGQDQPKDAVTNIFHDRAGIAPEHMQAVLGSGPPREVVHKIQGSEPVRRNMPQINIVFHEANDAGRQRLVTWLRGKHEDSSRLRDDVCKIFRQLPPHPPDGTRFAIDEVANWTKLSAEQKEREIQSFTKNSLLSSLVEQSLSELPIKMRINNMTVLPFMEASFTSFFTNIRNQMSEAMNAEMSKYSASQQPVFPAAVVVPIKDALLWALKEMLIQLPPVYDLHHPFVFDWNLLRLNFVSELWARARHMLQAYWKLRHEEEFPQGLPGQIPELVFAYTVEDRTAVFDITAGTLSQLMFSVIKRINEAFEVFWMQSLASLRDAQYPYLTLHKIIEISTAVRATGLFQLDLPEPMDPVARVRLAEAVRSFACQLPEGTVAEDMLLSSDIAATMFLSVYSSRLPQVISRLFDQASLAYEAAAARFVLGENGWVPWINEDLARDVFEAENIEASSRETFFSDSRPKRRRRQEPGDYATEAGEDLPEPSDSTESTILRRGGRRAARDQLDRQTDGLSAAVSAVDTIRKDQRALDSGLSGLLRRKEEPDGGSQAGNRRSRNIDSQAHLSGANDFDDEKWLSQLPLSLKQRLELDLPTFEVSEAFDRHMQTSSSLNGNFVFLEPSLANLPMITRWKPPQRMGNTGAVSFRGVSDLSLDYGGAAPLETKCSRNLSEIDWQMVKAVLECLHERGIDHLVSVSNNACFRICSQTCKDTTEFGNSCSRRCHYLQSDDMISLYDELSEGQHDEDQTAFEVPCGKRSAKTQERAGSISGERSRDTDMYGSVESAASRAFQIADESSLRDFLDGGGGFTKSQLEESNGVGSLDERLVARPLRSTFLNYLIDDYD